MYMYLIAIQLFVFIPIVGNQPGSDTEMELLQVFEAIEKCAVQTLMVSWAFKFLFLVGDCDE